MEEILQNPPETVTDKTIQDYLVLYGLADQVSTKEAERFSHIAQKYQLNPFLREIHLVASKDKGSKKFVAVVGYEVYLKRAERTGKIDGWKTWTEGDGEPLKAVIEIYRHDWSHPFIHEVHFNEAVQREADGTPTSFWKRMPKFQLRKVCISQGFRLCFPEELGGIPYEAAELSLDEVVATKLPEKPSAPSPTSQKTPDVFSELGEYLEANQGMFTAKHLRWIRDQIEKTPTPDKAKAMLAYAKKVVQGGGDPKPAPRGRAYPSRYPSRQEEAMPTF